MEVMTKFKLSELSPAMRQALGTATDGDLAGLYHGATLNALIRHGLATGSGHDEDREVYLSEVGLEARAEVRRRVDAKLAKQGYVHSAGAWYEDPDNPDRLVSRAAAMRQAKVRY